MQRRQRILFLLFGVLAAVLFVVDLSVGAVPIPIREVLAALTGSGNDPVTTKIILNIRLLKAVVALLAGAALAVSGLQMQTLFRNPLAGTVTAFCGPIGFIGLAVPHVARILFADADHRILVPASILTGIVVMLLCDVLAKLLTFPINTITALLGIPIVIWVVIRNKSIV